MSEVVTVPPQPGDLLWGTSLNQYLDYLEDRIVTLEGAPGGASLSFDFTDQGSAGLRAEFPSGDMRFDTSDQTAATAILASTMTANGADASLGLAWRRRARWWPSSSRCPTSTRWRRWRALR